MLKVTTANSLSCVTHIIELRKMDDVANGMLSPIQVMWQYNSSAKITSVHVNNE